LVEKKKNKNKKGNLNQHQTLSSASIPGLETSDKHSEHSGASIAKKRGAESQGTKEE
jgi:hypothetical protein